MRVTYDGGNAYLAAAAAFVNELDGNAAFWAEIEARGAFDRTKYTGAQIAKLMRNHSPTVTIKHYQTFLGLRHRHTNAYVERASPNVIYYNKRKLWRSTGDMVNTIVHEFVHVVDHAEAGSPLDDFTHDGQKEEGNDNAAPNWIGDTAQRYFDRSN